MTITSFLDNDITVDSTSPIPPFESPPAEDWELILQENNIIHKSIEPTPISFENLWNHPSFCFESDYILPDIHEELPEEVSQTVLKDILIDELVLKGFVSVRDLFYSNIHFDM